MGAILDPEVHHDEGKAGSSIHASRAKSLRLHDTRRGRSSLPWTPKTGRWGLGDPEIRDFHSTTLVQQDVLRLDVPMDDALFVRELQGIANLRDDLQSFAGQNVASA